MYPLDSFYPSNNTYNENLNSYTFDQTLPNKLSIYEISPNSRLENSLHSTLYVNIHSPYNFDENNDFFVQPMYDLYLQQRSQITEIYSPNPIGTEMVEHRDNIEEILGECTSHQNESVVIKEIPEKKTSKKDRHSKIETDQGPRDRRVRLSLQVARNFFDLQDTLGYTRASKTVEWLLSSSKAAIKDLTSSSANSPYSTFECEVVSREKEKHLLSPVKETKNTRGSTRKPAFNSLSKESREKARARARERTREKLKVDVLNGGGSETTTSNQMNQLGSWGQNQNHCFELEVFDDVWEPSSSIMFNYHMPNNVTSQEHQFTDFNLHGKAWNAYKQY